MTVSVDVLVGVVAEIVELAVFTGEPSLPDQGPALPQRSRQPFRLRQAIPQIPADSGEEGLM